MEEKRKNALEVAQEAKKALEEGTKAQSRKALIRASNAFACFVDLNT